MNAGHANAPDRVLVCLRYGIGDVVMELPALRGLRQLWPNAFFCALGAWPALELLEDDPLFQQVASIQAFGFEHWGDAGTPAARDSLARWCLDARFQRVMDAAHSPAGVRRVLAQSGIPAFNTGARLEVEPAGEGGSEGEGEGEGEREWIANKPAGGGGARSIWRSAVRAWGLTDVAPIPAPALHLSADVQLDAARFFESHALGRQPVVGITPVASSPLKRWPIELACELMMRLHGELGWQLLVFGIGAGDRPLRDALRRCLPADAVCRVEPMHLLRTAALIARCNAFLGNDTGLTHISAAVGTPTVAVFGPTSPHVALPAGAQAVTPRFDCRYRLEDRFGPPDCVLRERCLVREQSCIAEVGVDSVLAVLGTVLQGAGNATVNRVNNDTRGEPYNMSNGDI